MAQAQGQNVDTLLAGQLVNALSTMSIQERRRCEYHACVNFKEVQKEGEKVLVCSSCKSVGVLTVYCTVECQKGHWKEHKTVCIKQTTTTTTTTTAVTSATPSSADHAPPPLGEHVSQPMGFTANDLLKLLDKFKSAGSIPAARSSPGDEEDDDEEGDDEEDDEDEDDEDDDEEEEEEEEEINQDVDSFGRPLPQNRKKRRPAFSFGGNADDSEEEEVTKKEEEKVEPFLPFGPIQEGTRYWDFGAQPGGAAAGAPGPSPTKPAGRKRVQGRRGPAPSGEKGEPENKEALSALSFGLGNPGAPPATSSDSAAPVFSFGATSSSDDSVPTFTLGNPATVPTPSVPTTFQFGN